MSEGQEAYNVGIFHHLEAARQLHKEQLVAALAGTKHVALKHVAWSRIQDYRYSMTPLSLVGSLMQGGRFNIGNDIDPSQFPAFPALYVAEDYETAYAEKAEGAGKATGNSSALAHPHSKEAEWRFANPKLAVLACTIRSARQFAGFWSSTQRGRICGRTVSVSQRKRPLCGDFPPTLRRFGVQNPIGR
jgi:RES domain-containing protein